SHKLPAWHPECCWVHSELGRDADLLWAVSGRNGLCLGSYLSGVRGRPLCLSSPVCYKAILAIGHLSKLKPSLILEENCELLDQCLKSLFPLPPLEKMMKEEGETVKDALPIQ
ncbi:unnamed protein product, partial [Eretmochelys imbricata]